MDEVWKDIKGYEGLYQVSNKGRVRSLKQWSGNKHASKWANRVTILSPTDNGNGYLIVGLHKDGKRKNFYVHRLVAAAFIPADKNCRYINHKDHNRANNNVNNLEWCTQKENVNYSKQRMQHRKTITHTNTGEKYISLIQARGVYRLTIDRKEIGNFKTLAQAVQKRKELLNA